MKKLLALLCALAMMLTLAACGPAPDPTDPPTDPPQPTDPPPDPATSNSTTYLFETEYTYMKDVVGGGISGAAAGLNMIVESADASNGFYVGSTHSTKCVITYKVTSSEAATATLRVLLGSELGAMKLNPTSFVITVNGTAFTYEEIAVPTEVKTTGKTFTQFKLGDIQLQEGENIITFQVGPNEYCNGGPGGPLFDAIKLTSTATLTMEEHPENIE